MSTAQDIRAALEPVLAPLGLVVEDVSVSPAGKRRVVRVLVDSDIAGLDDADTTSAVPPLSLDTRKRTKTFFAPISGAGLRALMANRRTKAIIDSSMTRTKRGSRSLRENRRRRVHRILFGCRY